VSRPGKPFIKGHPQTVGCINPHDWLTEESNWPRVVDTPACEHSLHVTAHLYFHIYCERIITLTTLPNNNAHYPTKSNRNSTSTQLPNA
jgi:hypothetical protein